MGILDDMLNALDRIPGWKRLQDKPSVGVVCVQCNQQILVERDGKITEEFSVKCPKCGKPALYNIKDINPMGTS